MNIASVAIVARKTNIRTALAGELTNRSRNFARLWKSARIDASDAHRIHDVRIAARRLISAIDMSHTLEPRISIDKLRRRTKAEIRRFAALRDLQIVPEQVRPFINGQPKLPALQRLSDHEERTRDLVLASMDGRLVRRIRRGARKLAAELVSRRRKKDRACIDKYLGESTETFLKRASLIHPDDPQTIHRARLALKRLRYDLELGAQVLGSNRYTELIEAAKSLQDSMGSAQDLTVVATELESMSADVIEEPLIKDIRRAAEREMIDLDPLRRFESDLAARFD